MFKCTRSFRGNGQVEIVLAGWGGNPTETKLLNQTIQDFEKLHPSIHVKHEVITDQYMDILKTRLIGGNGPDVFILMHLKRRVLLIQGFRTFKFLCKI